jgi:dTMP kinase
VTHWVALEGGEGSGKSTQARLLADRLGALLTREPGGTAIGGRIRSLLLDPETRGMDDRAEALLMAADRAQHVAEVVEPALAGGRHVVSDRSGWSSLAYQGWGRGLDVDTLRSLSTWASGGRWPDLAILIDVDPATARSRMAGLPDRLEAAGEAFHARVADGFKELAAAEPDRWRVVDGSASVDDVELAVLAAYDAWAASQP